MADGITKPIEDLEIGCWVWAHDPETAETGARQVIDTIVGDGEKQLVDIGVLGDTITATDGHPFWVADDGAWMDADDLEPGDQLLLVDGGTTPVTAIAGRVGVQRVHNLTVEGIHTYHVVANDSAVLAHNCGVDELGGSAGDFDANELAQIAYQHAGEGDFVSTPTIDRISDALTTQGARLPDQNAVRLQSGDTVVIINEDNPLNSTAYISGGG